MDVRKLHITRIDTLPIRIMTARTMKSAKGATPWMDYILVKVHSNSGQVGIGEVECMPSYNRVGPEAPRGVEQIINETLGPLLIEMNPFDIEMINKKMNDRVQGHFWVKAGIDLAVWDLMGKCMNLPSYQLLGGRMYSQTPVEGVGYGIPMIEPEKVAEIAKGAVERGFTQLELKVGDEDASKDIERLRLTREAIGPKPSLKMDFNNGYDALTAINIIREMEEYGIQWVEQPVDYWNLEGMVRIRQSIHTPLIADECVNTAYEMMVVAKMGAADAIHIKPTVKGGMTEAKRIQHVAEAAGMFIIPGCLAPTGVGMAAVHAFMASSRRLDRGVHGSPLDILVDDIVKAPIPQHSPIVTFADGPGFGFELDEEKVEKYRVKS
jgi:L-alanine-DL-glutamate epimerase-like enolase superfamily enzyme